MSNMKCFVPNCTNSKKNQPQKEFFYVRKCLKKKWCQQAQVTYDSKYQYYCCEDHLNLEEDLENYYYWKFMKGKPVIKPTANLKLNSDGPLQALENTEEVSELQKLLMGKENIPASIVQENSFPALSAPPPPQQQQFIEHEAQPGTSSATTENQYDSVFDAEEHEVGVITEQQTGLEDPLADNSNCKCRFCAEDAKDGINPTDKPYLKNNKMSLTLNDIDVEINLKNTHKVCLDCDRKLLEMFNFVKLVKTAQNTLLNATCDLEETETLVVKTECESPTPDDNEINEDANEGIDSLADETVVRDVFTHKKRKCNEDTKRTTKRQKKANVEDIIKVTSEDSDLIMDIKEEPIEKDDGANTNINIAADSEDGDTWPDDKSILRKSRKGRL